MKRRWIMGLCDNVTNGGLFAGAQLELLGEVTASQIRSATLSNSGRVRERHAHPGGTTCRLQHQVRRTRAGTRHSTKRIRRSGSETHRIVRAISRMSSKTRRVRDKIPRIAEEISRIRSKISRIGSKIRQISSKISRIGSRIWQISSRISQILVKNAQIFKVLTQFPRVSSGVIIPHYGNSEAHRGAPKSSVVALGGMAGDGKSPLHGLSAKW